MLELKYGSTVSAEPDASVDVDLLPASKALSHMSLLHLFDGTCSFF